MRFLFSSCLNFISEFQPFVRHIVDVFWVWICGPRDNHLDGLCHVFGLTVLRIVEGLKASGDQRDGDRTQLSTRQE